MDRELREPDSRGTDAEAPEAYCPNCGSEATGPFCPSCGQPQAELIVSVGTWFRSTVSEILELDGTFLRTLRMLVGEPGRLTEAWVLGRRISFMKPVRLYLMTSAVLFGLLALPGLSMAGRAAVTGAVEGWVSSQSRPGALADAGLAAVARDKRAVERIAATITENLPRAMFLLLPFAALLLKALVRPRQHYVVHMVWALHMHAALYVVVAGMVLLDPLRGTAKLLVAYPLFVAGTCWACWYAVTAFSRAYRRSLARSLGLLTLLGASYVPVFLVTVVLISILALR